MMRRTQDLYLLFMSGFCLIVLGLSEFHLVELSKSFEDAKTYCRDMYSDVATVHNFTDMNELIALASYKSVQRAWIGLEIGNQQWWHWTWPGQMVDFLNWKEGNPLNNDEDACAAMSEDGEWFESPCGTKRSFVCHDNNESGAYVFVADRKSWRDAQDHCRDLSSDLVGIQSAEKNEAVRNASSSQTAWIGLFRDAWRWSDGSGSSFRYWRRSQPNYLEGQDCVAAIFVHEGKWNDLPCTGKRRFFCRGAMKYSSTASPASTQDATTIAAATSSSSSSQGIIITYHFTVTNGQSTAQSSTSGPTTVSPSPVTVTTELVSSTLTAGINNASSATLAATTSATPVETSVQPTTSSITLDSGKLILIQENMTWIQAMTYCRKHHIDLVHINNQDIQRQAAEVARNATSAHVWIGLRYTCNFNFWFWTSPTSACYLNWAPGQGLDREYGCGVAGAIEATGGQQWVGLSETEALNFICAACTG